MPWTVLDSGRLPPEVIMAKDAELLSRLNEAAQPILHLYEWEGKCLTYGYFTDPTDYLHLEALERHGLRMARRPTGGGILFHLTDYAFSILLPASHPYFSCNTLDNYAYVNSLVAQALEPLIGQKASLLDRNQVCLRSPHYPFCMAKPTCYDLILEGKKVGGAAQRRTKQGLLHQGSISLALPSIDLLKDVLIHSDVMEAMQNHTYHFLPPDWTSVELEEMRQKMKHALIQKLT